MSEVIKAETPKSEVEVKVKDKASPAPTVNKTKKETKKPDTPEKVFIGTNVDFESAFAQKKDDVAFLRVGRVDVELKDINVGKVNMDMAPAPWRSRIYIEMIEGNKAPVPKFTHVIIGDTLVILDQNSALQITGDGWTGLEGEVSHINDEYTNIPANIIRLESSQILTARLNVKGHNLLKRSSLKANYGITTENSNFYETSIYRCDTFNSSCNNLENSVLNAPVVYLEKLYAEHFNISASDRINITGSRYRKCKDVTINGAGIEKVVIDTKGRFHYTDQVRFFYPDDKGKVSVLSERRVDNGYFMGNTPIPFCRTETGILVGHVHFTYEQMKSFKEKMIPLLTPCQPESIDRHVFRPPVPIYSPFAPGIGSCVSGELVHDDAQTLSTLSTLSAGNNKYGNKNDLGGYKKVDSLLTIKNTQITMLAEQIFSRLQLFKELESII